MSKCTIRPHDRLSPQTNKERTLFSHYFNSQVAKCRIRMDSPTCIAAAGAANTQLTGTGNSARQCHSLARRLPFASSVGRDDRGGPLVLANGMSAVLCCRCCREHKRQRVFNERQPVWRISAGVFSPQGRFQTLGPALFFLKFFAKVRKQFLELYLWLLVVTLSTVYRGRHCYLCVACSVMLQVLSEVVVYLWLILYTCSMNTIFLVGN